jgi:hypothetical protein
MSLQTVQIVHALPLADRISASRTSINPLTHLATDFLNQFNEVAMSLDMLADWPDMFEELRNWQVLSYEDHFRRSGFADTETIVDAYWAAPGVIRRRFDDEVDALAHMTSTGLRALQRVWDDEPTQGMLEAAAALGSDIRTHVSKLAGIINVGHPLPAPVAERPADQADASGMNQSDIDAMFA